jgi:hypothetical protein
MKFRYPLPISRLTSALPIIDLHSIHLKFNSTLCTFTYRTSSSSSPFPQGSLYTHSNEWAGLMHNIQTPVLPADLEPMACEVVAISTGVANVERGDLKWEVERVEEIVPEVKHFEQIREAVGMYRFYNVMWLAWEAGVAYRRGIGRVWGPIWERQELRRVEVTLG